MHAIGIRKSPKPSDVARILMEYGLGGSDVDLLTRGASESYSYRVTREDGALLLLRVHTCADNVTRSEIETELKWLDILSKDDGFRVPKPVSNFEGLRIYANPQTDHNILAVLFDWIPGVRSSKGMSAETAFLCGRSIARLHRSGLHFMAPESFDRRWDESDILGSASWLMDGRAEVDLSSDRLQIVLEDGRIGLIDFAECGYGDALFDVASLLNELMDVPAT